MLTRCFRAVISHGDRAFRHAPYPLNPRRSEVPALYSFIGRAVRRHAVRQLPAAEVRSGGGGGGGGERKDALCHARGRLARARRATNGPGRSEPAATVYRARNPPRTRDGDGRYQVRNVENPFVADSFIRPSVRSFVRSFGWRAGSARRLYQLVEQTLVFRLPTAQVSKHNCRGKPSTLGGRD
jgi:hypothetical protein